MNILLLLCVLWIFMSMKTSSFPIPSFQFVSKNLNNNKVTSREVRSPWKYHQPPPSPSGLESALTLLFTEDCLDFLMKLVEAFDQKAYEVRISKSVAKIHLDFIFSSQVLRQRVLRRCAVKSGKLLEFVSRRPNKSKG